MTPPTKPQPTPGPWRATPRDDHKGRYPDGEHRARTIYEVTDAMGRLLVVVGEGHEADAHLIAAAPDLLAALRGAVNAWESGSGMTTAMALARQVLTRAEGREKGGA